MGRSLQKTQVSGLPFNILQTVMTYNNKKMWAMGMAHQTVENSWSELLRSLWKENEKAAIVWEVRATCFRYKKYEKSFMHDNTP